MTRRSLRSTTDADAKLPASPREPTGDSALAIRRAGPRSLDEAEARYIAARDEWVVAMREANSGRSADLASLAIAQEAYEAAAAEHERWLSGARVTSPVREPSKPTLGAIVGQELAWRNVQHAKSERRPGLIQRLANRFRRS